MRESLRTFKSETWLSVLKIIRAKIAERDTNLVGIFKISPLIYLYMSPAIKHPSKRAQGVITFAMGNSNAIIASCSSNSGLSSWLMTVLQYCVFPGPFYLLQTTKTLHRLLHTAPCCHFLCKLISQQYGVYIPKVLNEKEAWKTRLREMYAMRNIWQAKTDLITSHAFLVNGNNPSHQKMGHIEGINMKKFKINVYAKFRPLVSSTDSSMQTFKALMSHHDDSPQLIDNQSIDEGSYDQNKEESVNESIEVTLPLHQRLAMIKMSHNIKSNRQALKILATEGGWFAAKWNTLASNQKSAKDQDMSLLDIENRNESNIRYNPVMNGKKAEKLMAKGPNT